MKTSTSLRCTVGLGIMVLSGCGLVLGLDDFKDAAPAVAATSAGAGAAPAVGATSAGAGGGLTCEPDSVGDCYSGPAKTQGVGICRAGTQACRSDGSGYEDCSGEVTPAVETCASPDDEDCDGADCVAWARLIGGAEDELVNDLGVDAMGNVYVVGAFEGAISFGEDVLIASGESDAFLVKLSASGEYVWSRQMGGVNHESAFAIGVSPEGEAVVGVLVLGSTGDRNELELYKYEPNGDLSWRKVLGGSLCQLVVPPTINSIEFASDGSVVVVGSYCGELRFDEAHVISNDTDDPDAFVARIRTSDGLVDKDEGWVTILGGDGAQYASDVAVDAASNVVVVGYFWDALRSGDNLFQSSGRSDAFVAKVTSLGAVSWVRAFGGSGHDSADSVSLDRLGGPVVLGDFDGTFDLGGGEVAASKRVQVMFKYTTSNVFQWQRVFDVDRISVRESLVDSKGDLLIVSRLTGEVELGGETLRPRSSHDLLLAKMNGQGGLLWAKTFSEVGRCSVSGLGYSDLQGMFVAGTACESIDFGFGAMTPEGESDIYVARFVP